MHTRTHATMYVYVCICSIWYAVCMYVRTHARADGREWALAAASAAAVVAPVCLAVLLLLSVRLSCPSLVQPLLPLISHQLY